MDEILSRLSYNRKMHSSSEIGLAPRAKSVTIEALTYFFCYHVVYISPLRRGVGGVKRAITPEGWHVDVDLLLALLVKPGVDRRRLRK